MEYEAERLAKAIDEEAEQQYREEKARLLEKVKTHDVIYHNR